MTQDFWERVRGESSRAYAHFCLYRDMGKSRSVRKLAEDSKCIAKVGQLFRWSSRWSWVARARAYDDHVDRQLRLQCEQDTLRAAERQAKIGQLLQSKAIEKLANMDANSLTVNQALAAGKLGADLECRALGMPTEIIRSHVSTNEDAMYEAMTDDQLRESAIAALEGAGMSRENARVIVDQMSGATPKSSSRPKPPPTSNREGKPDGEL